MDARDLAWSGIIDQVPQEVVALLHVKQRHFPLSFLSGRFDAAQLSRSVLKKEVLIVLITLDKIHWLITKLQCPLLGSQQSHLPIRPYFCLCQHISDNSTQITLLGCETEHVRLQILSDQGRKNRLVRPSNSLAYPTLNFETSHPHSITAFLLCIQLSVAVSQVPSLYL